LALSAIIISHPGGKGISIDPGQISEGFGSMRFSLFFAKAWPKPSQAKNGEKVVLPKPSHRAKQKRAILRVAAF